MLHCEQIRSLINRLARLDNAETWESALNPAQIAALEYLVQANRFSRSPSHVADFMGTTRGTTSQTLKALVRKGYLIERRSDKDRRSISYDISEKGQSTIERRRGLLESIHSLPEDLRVEILEGLSELLRHQLELNQGRSFGICRTCEHHAKTTEGPFCRLLSLPLLPEDINQICHEHSSPQ